MHRSCSLLRILQEVERVDMHHLKMASLLQECLSMCEDSARLESLLINMGFSGMAGLRLLKVLCMQCSTWLSGDPKGHYYLLHLYSGTYRHCICDEHVEKSQESCFIYA